MTQPIQPVTNTTPVEKPKKKKRVFMWFFLVVQAIFILWIIAGANSASGTNCGSLSQADCDAAAGVGTAIGVGLILMLWAIVDIILVAIWAVVKLARR